MGSSPGARHELFPVLDFQHPAAANRTALAVLGDRFLLGLESSGLLHAWPQQGGGHKLWRLPVKEARWHGLCVGASEIFLTGTRHRDKSLGIWRMDLPRALLEDADSKPRTWSELLQDDL